MSAAREWIEDALIYALMWRGRWRQRRVSRLKRKVRSSAIATTRGMLEKASHYDAASIKTIFNVGMYLLLLDDDLAAYTDDIVCARDRHRRRFVAKHEAMLLYEAAEDLTQLLGRAFRTTAQKVGARPDQQQELNRVTSDVNSFWRANQEFLKTVRNAVVAHREKDALRYLDALSGLEPLEVMRRGAELSALLERLIRVVTGIALLTRNPLVIMQDISSGGWEKMRDAG